MILVIPVSLGVATTERGDAMFAAMAARATSQIVELESYTALTGLN